MDNNRLCVGLIGLGRQGHNHYNNLLTLSQIIKLKYVCDLKVDETWEREYSNIPVVTKDYFDVLNDPEVDAVVIVTSTNTHAQIIKDAALAGKHIFCEKPFSMDTNEDEIKDVLRIVKEKNVKLQMGFQRRVDPQFREIHENIISGKIGEPQIIKSTSRDPFVLDKELIKRIGTLPYDFTIHDLDLVRYMMNSNISEVYAKGGTLIDPTLKEIGDVDTIALVLQFENGTFGMIDNSRQAVYGYDQRIEVFGSEGMSKAENVSDSTVELFNKDNTKVANPLPIFTERFHQAYINEIVSFVDSVVNDKPVIADGVDAVMAERAAQAVEKSIKSGKPEKVDTVFEI